MSLINVSNLTFGYDGSYDNVFEDVSFQLDSDWKLGFTGRNGRGKTTFLKLLMGELEYKGKISAQVEFEYFPYIVKDPTLMAIEVVDEIVPLYEYWELSRELSLLQADDELLYRPYETLSNGEQTKVILAALFLKKEKFLLMDEPTNHLDFHARKVVGEYLKRKKGFILISHDRDFLDTCTEYTLSINRADIQVQKGSFSIWWKNKEMQDEYELNQNKKLKKDIMRLNSSAKRATDWSKDAEKEKSKNSIPSGGGTGMIDRGFLGHKAAKMMQRAKTIEKRYDKAIDEKSKLLKNIESSESLKLSPLKYISKHMVAAEKLTIKYGDKIICRNVNFSIEQGERVALMGKNGSGKSSIIKLLMGEEIGYDGYFNRGSQLRISYVSQDISALSGSLEDYAEKCHVEQSLFKAILRKLDFSRLHFDKDISQYSAGQKKKVMIARSLAEQAHLYVWDEPLNYIDIISRMQIQNLIKEYMPTLIFVEHDSAFLNEIATQKIELSKHDK